MRRRMLRAVPLRGWYKACLIGTNTSAQVGLGFFLLNSFLRPILLVQGLVEGAEACRDLGFRALGVSWFRGVGAA